MTEDTKQDRIIYDKYVTQRRKIDLDLIFEEYFPSMKFHSGESILDIGCGSGVISKYLLEHIPVKYGRFLGIDISEAAIENARNGNLDQRMSFEMFDFNEPVSGKSFGLFDHIFSFLCFYFLKDHKQSFKNVLDLLKPGGEILFLLLSSKFPMLQIWHILINSTKWNRFLSQMKSFSDTYNHIQDQEEFIRRILKEAGFINVKYKTIMKKYPYVDYEVPEMFIRPLLHYVPLEKQNELFNDFKNLYKCFQDINIIEENGIRFICRHEVQLYAMKPSYYKK